jgi:hypothetical protein
VQPDVASRNSQSSGPPTIKIPHQRHDVDALGKNLLKMLVFAGWPSVFNALPPYMSQVDNSGLPEGSFRSGSTFFTG